jgi:hypothetical protein
MKKIFSDIVDLAALWAVSVTIFTLPYALFGYIHPLEGLDFALAYGISLILLCFVATGMMVGFKPHAFKAAAVALNQFFIYLSLCHWFDPVTLGAVWVLFNVTLSTVALLGFGFTMLKSRKEIDGGALWN